MIPPTIKDLYIILLITTFFKKKVSVFLGTSIDTGIYFTTSYQQHLISLSQKHFGYNS